MGTKFHINSRDSGHRVGAASSMVNRSNAVDECVKGCWGKHAGEQGGVAKKSKGDNIESVGRNNRLVESELEMDVDCCKKRKGPAIAIKLGPGEAMLGYGLLELLT